MKAGFAVLYTWTVVPALEDDFVKAWSVATMAYRTIGALGSRLHRSDEGEFVAYAEWPSREVWQESGARSPVDEATSAKMRAATLSFSMHPLLPIADLLQRS